MSLNSVEVTLQRQSRDIGDETSRLGNVSQSPRESSWFGRWLKIGVTTQDGLEVFRNG